MAGRIAALSPLVEPRRMNMAISRGSIGRCIGLTLVCGAAVVAVGPGVASPDVQSAPKMIAPETIETRTVNLTQTVSLADIPAGSKRVQLWVPIPSDTNWQRVLDCKVVSAPGKWRILRQEEGRGIFVHVDVQNPTSPK